MGWGRDTVLQHALLAILILLLAGTAAAADITLTEPEQDETVTDMFRMNATANNTTSSATITFYHNESGGAFTDTIYSAGISDGSGWANTTNDSAALFSGDGPAWINATLTNGTDDQVASDRVRIQVDNEPPEITAEAPDDGANVSGSIYVNASATDVGSSVDDGTFRYWLMNETGEVTDERRNIDTTIDTTAFADGLYNITLRAKDASGNENRTNITDVRIDNTAPDAAGDLAITNTSAAGSIRDHVYTTDETPLELNWTAATDGNGSGVAHYNITVERAAYDRSSYGFNNYTFNKSIETESTSQMIEETELEDGYRYRYTVEAVDRAGNIGDADDTPVIFDTSGPQFALTAAGDKDVDPLNWTDQENLTLVGTVTDLAGINATTAGDQAVNVTFTHDGTDKYPNATLEQIDDNGYTYAVHANVTGLVEGASYDVSVAVSDRLGYRNQSMNWSFQTDFTAPPTVDYVTHSEPAYDGTWYRDELVAEVSCTDDASGPAQVTAEASTDTAVNTSLVDGAANLTLTASGDTVYTFSCTDHAGNTNSTPDEGFRIDDTAPAGISSDIDGLEDIEANFTFTATFTNQSGFSGIDGSASEVELEKLQGQDGSLGSVDWDDGQVAAEVTGLSPDESYMIHVTAVDNVGHEREETIEFRTAGGDGGGSDAAVAASGDARLALMNVDSPFTVPRGGTTDVSFQLQNIGDTNLTGIDAGFVSVDDLALSLEPAQSYVEPGASVAVSGTLEAAADAIRDTYKGSIRVTSSGADAAELVDIEVTGNEPEIAVSTPDRIEVDTGGSTRSELVFANEQDTAAEVAVDATVPNVSLTLGDDAVTVPGSGEETVAVVAAATDDLPAGIYEMTVTATYGETTDEYLVPIHVQPTSDGEKQQIERDITALADDIDEDSELQETLAAAQDALKEEDYARAAELQQQLREELETTSGGADDGFSLWSLFVLLLVAVTVGGVGYLVVVRQDVLQELMDEAQEHNFDYSFQEPSGMERMKQRVIAAAAATAERVQNVSAGDIDTPEVSAPDLSVYRDRGDGYTLPDGQLLYKYNDESVGVRRWLDAASANLRERFDALSSRAGNYQLYEYVNRVTEQQSSDDDSYAYNE